MQFIKQTQAIFAFLNLKSKHLGCGEWKLFQVNSNGEFNNDRDNKNENVHKERRVTKRTKRSESNLII